VRSLQQELQALRTDTRERAASLAAAESSPPVPPRTRSVKREPEWAERLVAQGIACLKRGNPLARIGVVILFFGGVFLAR